MKRLRAKTRDIFEIPSDESVDTPAQVLKRHKRNAFEEKRTVLASKDTNITQRSKRKAAAVVSDTRPPHNNYQAPITRQDGASTKSKIPVRVKEKPSQTPVKDIRSSFKPHTPLLDQMQECMSAEQDGDYWQQAKNKKSRNTKRGTRPGTTAVQHGRQRSPSPASEPATPMHDSIRSTNRRHAGNTPRYPKVLVPPTVIPDRKPTIGLRSKQAGFGIGATYLPQVIPEYDWTVYEHSEEELDLDLDFDECVTSTPIRAFRRHETSLGENSPSPTR